VADYCWVLLMMIAGTDGTINKRQLIYSLDHASTTFILKLNSIQALERICLIVLLPKK